MLRGMRVERAGSRLWSEFVILDTGQLLNLPGGAAHTVLHDGPALLEVGRDRRARESSVCAAFNRRGDASIERPWQPR